MYKNSLELIHVFNNNDTYYLTRDTLINSAITQETTTFFCHILTLDRCNFNDTYSPFAYLQYDMFDKNVGYLYLNVDSTALSHIIKYVQSGCIDGVGIYKNNYKDIEHIIYLAYLMELPKLVKKLEALYPTDNDTDLFIRGLKTSVLAILAAWDMFQQKYNLSADLRLPNNYQSVVLEFFDQNIHILKQWYKQIHHSHQVSPQYQFMIRLLIKLFVARICETQFDMPRSFSEFV